MRPQTYAWAVPPYLSGYVLARYRGPSTISFLVPALVWVSPLKWEPNLDFSLKLLTWQPVLWLTQPSPNLSQRSKPFQASLSWVLLSRCDQPSSMPHSLSSKITPITLEYVSLWVAQLIQKPQLHSQPYTCPMQNWTPKTVLAKQLQL